MIYHDDINVRKSPYTIRICGAGNAGAEARNMMRLLASAIDKHGSPDRGGDLEVTILIED